MLSFFRVDAFCDGPRGNPAAVVLCADGSFPSTDAMRGISQSFLCDTCFLIPPPPPQPQPQQQQQQQQQPKGPLALRAKFFTAKPQEAVFIGHAAVAALAVIAPSAAEGGDLIEYELTSGPDGSLTTTSMTARRAAATTYSFVVPHPNTITAVPVDEALERAIAATPLSANIVIGTSSRLILFVEDMGGVTPNRAAIEDVSRQNGVGGVFVVQQNLSDIPPTITTRYENIDNIISLIFQY
jgi:predicted PhzF superfamily epimerase YddE/YHI9